jgi:hypothetical protein
MKRFLLIVPLSLAAACASISAGSHPFASRAGAAPGGHWQGYLLHDGLREPVQVDLDSAAGSWTGTYSAGDNAVPLQSVKFDESGAVHFELQGKGSFDGAVAGDTMAGTVSGSSSGSFALSRDPGFVWDPGMFGSP